MAKMIGRPRGIPDDAVVTAIVRFPVLHQAGSNGLSAPEYRLTLPSGASTWKDDATAADADLPFTLPGGPVPTVQMLIGLTVTEGGRSRTAVLPGLLPQVTPGTTALDLAQPQNAVAWVTSATLEQLIAAGNTATAATNTAITNANAATAGANTAKTQLTASVTQALTDSAQATAGAAAAAGFKPDAQAAAAAKPDALAAAAAKPDAQSAAALLPSLQAGVAAAGNIAGFTFKVLSPTQVINGVNAVLVYSDANRNVIAYWDVNGTMYAPGGINGSLIALSAAITTATIATLTATAATLGGSTFTVAGSGYVGNTPVAFALQGAGGSAPLYIDLAGVVYAPGGLNVSNLVVSGSLTLAALSAANATLGGVQFSSVNAARYVNGVLASNIEQDTAGNVVSYYGPDGMRYFPGGISAPNAVPGLGLAADGRVTINGMKMITSKNMVAFGDSLTAGSGSSSTAKTPVAQAATILGDGRTTTNKGMGGNQAQHIAARAGALPVYVTVTGGSLPADTSSVTVTPTIRLLDGSSIKTTPVSIAGVVGTLTHDNGDSSAAQQAANPYTFARTTAGSAVAVSGSVAMLPDNTATADDLHLIWEGVNDLGGSDTAGIVARVQAAIKATVDNIRTPSKRFAVLTLIPGARTSSSDPLYYAQMLQINAWIAATYPSNYIDVTTPLITYGGNSDGSVPAVLRVDIIHMTDAGYFIVGNEIAKFIIWKGY